ncbi:MAG: FkbM family methyltransferase [Pikeienuella sp.]|uniref:FkbM family methyltransferase n=1 Tax=Pikeienuella sp. TaxID=2831957 RepID=UPI0039196BD3
MSAPALYVVNRAADEARLARFTGAAEALGLGFARIEAMNGHDPDFPFFLYEHLLPETFWGEDRIKPGAFGCLLSHRAAWARMLADGAETALICEDDAVLSAPPSAVPVPGGFDVVFCGARLAAWRDGPGLVSVPHVLSTMDARRPGAGGLTSAPGAEAYLLSRAGARRLLALSERDGARAGVDWLMLGWSAPAAARPGWPEWAHLPEGGLKAFVADPIAEAAPAPSVIRHRETVPLAALRCLAPLSGLAETGGLDDPAARALAEGRYPALPALDLLFRWMRRGGLFVDIGAHLGAATLFMLRHGGAARAIAFEWADAASGPLRRSLAAAGLEARAETAHLGLGLAESRGRLAVRGDAAAPWAARLKPDFAETIPVRAGDTLLRAEAPDLILLDVNGEEREVLKGLRKTIGRHAPVIALAMTHERSAKALPLLARRGYREAERIEWEEGGEPRRLAVFVRRGDKGG